jgi:hypothetical protein
MTNQRYFSILKTSFSTRKAFIRNKNLPICSKCSHFIEHSTNYPYEPLPSDKEYGKCKKFGEINFITGLIEYDFAKHCRDDNNRCGKSGSEYNPKL